MGTPITTLTSETAEDLVRHYNQSIVALTLWREARNQQPEAIRGVLWVIINRVNDSRYPNTGAGVALQPRQFSCHNKDDPNATKLPLPNDPHLFKCCSVMANPGDDPTGGATHYHSFSNPEDFPKWALPSRFTTKIGAFHFYKLRPGE